MLRNFLAGTFVITLVSSAWATNLNMNVKATANNTNAVTVAPNAPVDFYIEGTLGDDLNEGLALVGFNLHFTGGALAADTVDIPAGAFACGNPMPAFVKPEGITNPAGFQGTLISGELVQVGGGQNTIRNTVANAPFPIGAVLLGVARPGGCGTAVIATGGVTAPAAEGSYQLHVQELFANVIRDGETGEVFYATDAAGVGTITNLTINVVSCQADTNSVVSSSPVTQKSLWKTQRNVARLTFASNLAAVPAIQIRELLDAGAFGPDLSANFIMSIEGGTVLRIADNGSHLAHRKWYAVSNDADCDGLADFEFQFVVQIGDANNDGRVLFTDLANINACIPTDPAADSNRRDINGDGRVLFTDMAAANARIPSDIVPKPTGH